MENQSVPFPDQNFIFEPETEKHMTALAMQGNDCVQDASGKEFFAFKPDKTMAVTVSVLLHLVAAVFLFMLASPATLPVSGEEPQVIQVTWVDAPRLSGKDSLAGHGAIVQSPAVAVQKRRETKKEQSLPEERINLSTPEAVMKSPATVPVDPSHATAVINKQTSALTETGHEKIQVVALGQSLKTSGADNQDAYTSTAKPRYQENAPPPYPVSSRLRGHEGVVLISAEILSEGRVGNAKIKSSSGYGILDQSALEAVRAWKFDPARKMGKPVPVRVDIPVRFVLND